MEPFQRIAIIGMGLIGSSIARAARHRFPDVIIQASDSDTGVVARARELGLADSVAEHPAEVVEGAELIILAVPLGAFATVATAIAPHLAAGAIVSDVGSAKQTVIEALQPVLPESVHLIPAHPVAGTEQSGPDAGFASLFEGRWCIVTPPRGADARACERVVQFWRALGSTVEVMEARHHDLVLAATSHIPHLIAYSVVGTAADLEDVTRGEVIKYSAGGFRDFTRIAASNPTMWRDVFLTNRDAVLEVLGRVTEDLAALQKAIRWGDGDTLFQRFTQSRDIRRAIIEAGQDTPAPDFGRPHKPD